MSTHLQNLQEAEEPSLQEILESKHHQMPIRHLGVGQQRLIGKVSQLAAFFPTTGYPPIGQSFQYSHPLVLVPTSASRAIFLPASHGA